MNQIPATIVTSARSTVWRQLTQLRPGSASASFLHNVWKLGTDRVIGGTEARRCAGLWETATPSSQDLLIYGIKVANLSTIDDL